MSSGALVTVAAFSRLRLRFRVVEVAGIPVLAVPVQEVAANDLFGLPELQDGVMTSIHHAVFSSF